MDLETESVGVMFDEVFSTGRSLTPSANEDAITLTPDGDASNLQNNTTKGHVL